MGTAMMGSGSGAGENRAVEATELAVSSPLLEDINLKGARGILVNVISGMDITLGEVNTIGEMVQEIASEDAQIVFGSGFDPSLQDEVRVTIVATGLNQPQLQQAPQRQEQPIEVVKRKASGEVDYSDLDKPTAIRRNRIAVGDELTSSSPAVDEEYLDIPAFLRRQAD